jgi:hypothetical protein
MQKLDFTENINILIEKLKSEKIVDFIDSIPINGAVNTNGLTPLIIESKSSYDKIEEPSKEFEIINVLNGQQIYDQKYISDLINQTIQTTLNKQSKVHLFVSSKLLQFYNFHFSLIQSAKIANEILFTDDKLNQIESDEIIVFRILVGEGNLDLSSYGKILKLIDELIQILEKIYDTENQESSKVVLLDSGSDANIGVKSSVQIATSLFQIFKEVWDWILNRKFYKSKLRNDAMLENLQVFNAIRESEKNGAIDSNTAKIYRETLLRRTENLLDLKVLPKKLIETKTEISSRKVLSEYTEIKVLEEGNKKE